MKLRSLILVPAVALFVNLVPASAGATSRITHRALIASEHRFDTLAPSDWRHGRVKCRRAPGAKVWRCVSFVTGTHHYQGVFHLRVTAKHLHFVSSNVHHA